MGLEIMGFTRANLDAVWVDPMRKSLRSIPPSSPVLSEAS